MYDYDDPRLKLKLTLKLKVKLNNTQHIKSPTHSMPRSRLQLDSGVFLISSVGLLLRHEA